MSDPTIGTRELRSGLATHLRRAEAGERIVVTVDDHPVAQMGPLEPTSGPTLADLIAVGLVEPPRRNDRPEAQPANELAAELSTSRALSELRGR